MSCVSILSFLQSYWGDLWRIVREWMRCGTEMSSDSCKSLVHSDPPCLLVSIPRPWSQKSWFHSQYQDLRFESLNSSLDFKTQISKVSIPVLISRLNYLDSSLNIITSFLNLQPLSKPWDCLCKARITRKCNSTNVQNAPVWQKDPNFWANVAILCPVRRWIAYNLLVIYIFTESTNSNPLCVLAPFNLFAIDFLSPTWL